MDATGFAFFLAIGAIGASFLLGPVGRSIAKRLGGREQMPIDEDAAARLQELEQRLMDVEQATSRMAELEERLDFAERLLTRNNPAERLQAPDQK